MLKGLINRILNIREPTDGLDLSEDLEKESVDLTEQLGVIRHTIYGSGYLDQLIEILNDIDYQFERLNSMLLGIRDEVIPNSVMSTLRIIRWDGKVIAQKGTVVSRYKDIFPLDTMTGEYGLEIVLTNKPNIETKFRIMWIGLDYAGKTTLLHRLRYNEFIQPKRTVGQELEDVVLEGLQITNIDLGGQKALRQHWSRFPLLPNVIVFVIDILDDNRFIEAYEELKEQVIDNDRYNKLPILIVVNKIDEYRGSSDPVEYVTSRVDLLSLLHDRTWHLQAASAITGKGLGDIVEILSKILTDYQTGNGV